MTETNDVINLEEIQQLIPHRYPFLLVDKVINYMDHDYIEGLSLLGGEPLEPKNQEGLLPLVKKVKEKFPETLLLFVTPPNAVELRNRLVGRGTETMEVIDSRMKRAGEEAEGMEENHRERPVVR